MKILLKILCFLVVIEKSLLAEVEEIQLRWNAISCLETCIPLLQRNLMGIKHGTNVQINGRSGVAVMGWNPNYPFSYEPFRAAFAATGVLILEMRVRVRGTITHDVDNFYLISNGDDARFLLIGPLHPEPGRYVPHYSLTSYPLTPNIKESLLRAERNQLTVIISGPLYLPEKYPRTLITERIKIQANETVIDPRLVR